MSATPNWTNGEIVVRRAFHATVRTKITNHSGSVIKFTADAGSPFTAGFGYFVQNHLSTLDQDGEWFYDPATKKIKIYYSVTPPSIEVATLTNLVNMDNTNTSAKSNVTFKGISFRGLIQE